MPDNQEETEKYPQEVLKQVREKVSEEYSKSSEFDEKEYHRILTDDVYLRRYIQRKRGDVPASISLLVDAIKWRKKMGISDMTEATFPAEFFDIGGIHVYNQDKDGNVVVHVRLRLFQKVSEILDLLKKFTIFQMLKADEEAAKKGGDCGWVLLFDCTGAGVANADIEMASFVNSTLRNYFPSGQKYVLNHNLPWLLNAVKSIVFAMIPSHVKKRIRFSNEKTITDHIPSENLPEYMGGSCNRPSRVTPRGVKSTEEMLKEGLLTLSPEEHNRVKKYYEKLFNELNKAK